MKRFALIFALMLVPLISLAESSGDNNGKPFLELQAAVDAALAAEAAAREAADAAEASAREAADTAEALARDSADALESATRAAADAALSAQIAAEEAARIAADNALQAEIAAHDALLVDLDGRVSVLEGLHLARSITWTETTGTFDVTNISGDIAGLGYLSGEWMSFISHNASTGREIGNCTNHARVGNWLNAAAAGGYYDSNYLGGTGSHFLLNGNWYTSPTFRLYTRNSSSYQVLQIFSSGSTFNHFVIDRKGLGSHINFEVYSRYSSLGGNTIGNTLTINVAATRLEACGF